MKKAPTQILALAVAISISTPDLGRGRDRPNVRSFRSIPEIYFRVYASELSSHETIELEKAMCHVRSCYSYKTAYTRTRVLLPYTLLHPLLESLNVRPRFRHMGYCIEFAC